MFFHVTMLLHETNTVYGENFAPPPFYFHPFHPLTSGLQFKTGLIEFFTKIYDRANQSEFQISVGLK